MLINHTVAFIGGGHITEIIIRRLITGNVVEPVKIFVSDPIESRCNYLSQMFGVTAAGSNLLAARSGDLVMVCVRPQVVKTVIPDLKAAVLRPEQVVISVAAGVPLAAYASLGERQALVRALPNPPSQVGQGIAPLVFSQAVSPQQRQLVLDLFSVLGEWLEVDEAFINAITSLSSPVATYHFLESLVTAGVACGLPREVAEKVAAQTITGSIAVWRSKQEDAAELIKEASTPGGVSETSMIALEKLGFRDAVVQAILRGASRSEELGLDTP